MVTIQLNLNNKKAKKKVKSQNSYKFSKSNYDWDDVFIERIDQRINLDADDLRDAKTPEEFKSILKEKYLTGQSNNEDKFWKEIEESEGFKAFNKQNVVRHKIEVLNKKGIVVGRTNSTIYYSDRFKRQGKPSKVFRDMGTGRFVKKPDYVEPVMPDDIQFRNPKGEIWKF